MNIIIVRMAVLDHRLCRLEASAARQDRNLSLSPPHPPVVASFQERHIMTNSTTTLLMLRAPDETGHAALMSTIAAHIRAGRIVPCVDRGKGAGSPWTTDRPGSRRTARDAAKACHGCPALTECRDYALKAPEAGGVWGGMTSKDRAALARRDRVGGAA